MQLQTGFAGKFLIFWLGDEEFAVPALQVKQIAGMREITPVPLTAPFVRGVINLRGKLVPVLDLRLRLGMSAAAVSEGTFVVVMQQEGPEGVYLIGVVVDRIDGVSQIEDRRRAKILLDIDKVLWEAGQQRLCPAS